LARLKAQSNLPLWPKGEPLLRSKPEHAQPQFPDDEASLLVFPADSMSNGTGIVICPGGAYGMLALEKEGIAIAQWLNGLRISAFVLRYRLGPVYRHPIQLEEGKRAIRWVRSHAKHYRLDPNKIGMMGFSAGGHLTAMVTGISGYESEISKTKPGAKSKSKLNPLNPIDTLDRQSSQPDFQILIYPVISFEAPFTHRASRNNLLGPNPNPALLHFLSAENHITPRTPPTFLVHAKTDPVVSFSNSEAYFQACLRTNIPIEFMAFEKGGHGFGLANAGNSVPELSTWPDSCARWMKKSGWLDSVNNSDKVRFNN
jgi:acetyl esterase/lipase